VLLQVKYLCDSGFAAAGLLTAPPEAADAASDSAAAAAEKGEDAESDSLPNWVHAVARPVEALGDSLVQLGSWIRTKFSGEAAADKEEGAQGKGERAPGGTPWVLTAVMTAMVAIVAIIILRRR
jgi:mannose/fructose/N-acetylgalactosamine-specific phosphotransferase system component IIC